MHRAGVVLTHSGDVQVVLKIGGSVVVMIDGAERHEGWMSAPNQSRIVESVHPAAVEGRRGDFYGGASSILAFIASQEALQ